MNYVDSKLFLTFYTDAVYLRLNFYFPALIFKRIEYLKSIIKLFHRSFLNMILGYPLSF